MLALGLLFFLATALWVVWSLDMRVTTEALAHHGRQVERQVEAMVERLALEELAHDGGGWDGFARRLADAAQQAPGIRELVVLRPGERSDHPCLEHRARSRRTAREHPAGELERSPVGCIVLPVRVDGVLRATVLLHLTREWAAGGALVQSAVRQTAGQLAPVFLLFYLLLGGMLVVATKVSARWRGRAVQAERAEALGALAAGVSHEIKNPLNALSLCLQVLERRHADPESRETLGMAREQSREIEARLDDFARFVRAAQPDFREIDLAPRIREWLGDRAEVYGEATARVDAGQMRESMEAICELLASSAPAGEAVRVRLGTGSRSWHLKAEAAAPDFDPASIEHLFDPYRRNRPWDVDRGLAGARAVFRAHGGDLTASCRRGRLEIVGVAANQPGV